MRKVAAALVLLAVVAVLVWLVLGEEDGAEVADSSPVPVAAEEAPPTPLTQHERVRRTEEPVERRERVRRGETTSDAGDDDDAASNEFVGFVTDEDGTELEGATITVRAMESGATSNGPDAVPTTPATVVLTDAEGRFALPRPEADRVHVVAEHPTHARWAGTLPARGEPPTIELDERFTLRLRVESAQGGPLANARVGLSNGRVAAMLPTPTDRAGRITLTVGRRHEVFIRAKGHVGTSFDVRGGSETERLVVLAVGHSFTGRVVDTEGRAIEGASVWAALQERVLATTDETGTFKFDRVLPREDSQWLRVSVNADGYMPRTLPLTPSDNTVVLSGGVMLSGVVRFPDGSVAQRTEVKWRPVVGPTRSTRTNADGRFTILLALPEPGRLDTNCGHAAGEGDDRVVPWGASVEIDTRGDQKSLEFELVLQRLERGFLNLSVVDTNGAPVPRYWVRITEVGVFPDIVQKTDDQGRVALTLPRPAGPTLSIHVFEPGQNEPLTVVRTPASAEPAPAEQQIVVPAARTVALRLTDAAGKPIDGKAWRAKVGTVGDASWRTQPDGTLRKTLRVATRREFEGWAEALGVYRVVIDPEQLGAPDEDGLHHLDARLFPAASLTGRITSESGAVPACEIELSVLSTETSFEFDEFFEPDAKGHFLIEGIPAGDFVLRVHSESTEQVLAFRNGVLSGGRRTDLGDVTIDVAHWTTTRVLDAAGRPVRGAEVSIHYPPRWQAAIWEATDANGDLRMPPTPGSGQLVRIQGQEGQVAWQRIEGGTNPTEIRTHAGAALRITPHADEPGEPDLRVHARVPETDVWIEVDQVGWAGGYRGEIALDRLPPGRLRLQLTTRTIGGPVRTSSVDVTAKSGEALEVELPLTQPAR